MILDTNRMRKPLNEWRLFWLRVFDAKIEGKPFVHQRARIAIPWNLTLHDRACLGDRANAYSLGEIEIGARAILIDDRPARKVAEAAGLDVIGTLGLLLEAKRRGTF